VTLSVRQAASWRDDGYLLFPGFFDEPEVRVVTDALAAVSEIADPTLTRYSLVTHFWGQDDCQKAQLQMADAPGASGSSAPRSRCRVTRWR